MYVRHLNTIWSNGPQVARSSRPRPGRPSGHHRRRRYLQHSLRYLFAYHKWREGLRSEQARGCKGQPLHQDHQELRPTPSPGHGGDLRGIRPVYMAPTRPSSTTSTLDTTTTTTRGASRTRHASPSSTSASRSRKVCPCSCAPPTNAAAAAATWGGTRAYADANTARVVVKGLGATR